MRYLAMMACKTWVASVAVLSAVSLGACAKRASLDDTAANPNGSLALESLSVPLDLQQVEVGEGLGYRGVFLKLTRLPDAVAYSSESDPARIILEIKGPTGAQSPEERIPSGDVFVPALRVSRELGLLRVVIDLAADDPPVYTVQSMADWIMIRLGPPT